MVDNYPLRYIHQHPEPAQGDGEEETEVLDPVEVEVVYNFHEKAGNSKTIALKVSFRLPVNSSGCIRQSKIETDREEKFCPPTAA